MCMCMNNYIGLLVERLNRMKIETIQISVSFKLDVLFAAGLPAPESTAGLRDFLLKSDLGSSMALGFVTPVRFWEKSKALSLLVSSVLSSLRNIWYQMKKPIIIARRNRATRPPTTPATITAELGAAVGGGGQTEKGGGVWPEGDRHTNRKVMQVITQSLKQNNFWLKLIWK